MLSFLKLCMYIVVFDQFTTWVSLKNLVVIIHTLKKECEDTKRPCDVDEVLQEAVESNPTSTNRTFGRALKTPLSVFHTEGKMKKYVE